MPTKLPEGFESVPVGRKPSVSFDVQNNRFYLSRSLIKEHDIRLGSRVGLAYNSTDRQLLIDLSGWGFKVDQRGYITSKYFIGRSYGDTLGETSSIKYVYNEKLSSDNFLIFDEI